MGTGQSHAKCFAWMGPPKLPRAHFQMRKPRLTEIKAPLPGVGGTIRKCRGGGTGTQAQGMLTAPRR